MIASTTLAVERNRLSRSTCLNSAFQRRSKRLAPARLTIASNSVAVGFSRRQAGMRLVFGALGFVADFSRSSVRNLHRFAAGAGGQGRHDRIGGVREEAH